MRLRLAVAAVYIPAFIRKRKLEMLFEATADAFGTAVPVTADKSCYERLDLYARFTRAQADASMRRGDEPEVRKRLFQNSCRIGTELREDFALSDADVMRMGSLVYKMLGIDFRGQMDGQIVIGRCFFSDYYSSAVCRFISSLDEGLLVGLAGGGTLTFSQRITEGYDCCRAVLAPYGRPAR